MNSSGQRQDRGGPVYRKYIFVTATNRGKTLKGLGLKIRHVLIMERSLCPAEVCLISCTMNNFQ